MPSTSRGGARPTILLRERWLNMEMQDKLAVSLVAGSEPERFCIVFVDGRAVKRIGVGYESAIRTELQRRGLSDADIDSLIAKGRDNPS